ncbi:thiamin-phosphate pyrophosphorylase [Vibrio maritimus]|uniref:Thiamine-phosphate synthase n=1 Tax=Vibrio maritimus TaxID=990268 RepID=A0A090TDV3_9VIBR|nr:thiamin-phosphate pyrophosphorylase [Vibrio maritimus]
MKLMLPIGADALNRHIHCVLGLAKQAGFSTENIAISSSEEGEAVVIQYEENIRYISSDVLGSTFRTGDSALNSDVRVRYLHDMDESKLSSSLATATQGDVYITVASRSRWLDVWSCRDNVIKASAAASLITDHTEHLAWLVVSIALDFPLEDAVMVARAGCVSRETWPSHLDQFPVPVIENTNLGIRVGWAVEASALPFPTVSKSKLGLYPVVDNVDWVAQLLEQGIKTVQLRIKQPDLPDLEQQIEKAIELGRRHDAQVFINDYWQLAIKHGAYGVHLGQEDIEVANLKQLAEQGIALGLSTHGYYELLRIVQIHPSYIALGHIFATTTKDMPSKPQGLIRLELYQRLIDSIPYGQELGYPTVAIGGIDLKTAPAVWSCGVTSLAVVRAITLADDVPAVIQQFNSIMDGRLDG